MLLEISELKKSFGSKKVLEGINITAHSGRAFGLLGRNGAGKTTTIRILMNIFGADSGAIRYDGKQIDYKKIGLGYLPEERGLYPKLEINSQLLYLAKLKGMTHKNAQEGIDYWLKRLELFDYKNKKIETLSKGNQQKIQLITTIIHEPEIIFLDEPFSGLDPVNARVLKDIVKEEIQKGKIVFFSSHQMNYIEEFCDDIAVLNKGRVAITGGLDEIKKSYDRDKLVIASKDARNILANEADSYESSQGDLMIKLSEPSNKQLVMQRLIQKYDIDELKVYEPTLNDIFVEYTREV